MATTTTTIWPHAYWGGDQVYAHVYVCERYIYIYIYIYYIYIFLSSLSFEITKAENN